MEKKKKQNSSRSSVAKKQVVKSKASATKITKPKVAKSKSTNANLVKNSSGKKDGGFILKMTRGIERVGNKLPHPVMIFVILSVAIAFVSSIMVAVDFTTVLDYGKADAAASRGVSLQNWSEFLDWISANGLTQNEDNFKDFIAANGDVTLPVVSLLSGEGFKYIFTSAVTNFTGFAPLGVVLVAMLGIGIAEEAGLISVMLKKIAMGTSEKMLPYVMVFLGIMSNLASDAGYVVLIPLGAALFYAAGRHPLAGMAAAFAGVSAGFSANLLPTPTDALLINITNETLGDGNEISVISNYFFMIASTILISIVGGFVTAKVVEPTLGKYHGKPAIEIDDNPITAIEKKGLRAVLISLIIMFVVFIAMAWPNNTGTADAPVYEAIWGPIGSLGGGLTYSNPFVQSLVFVITIMFAVMGIVYGKKTKVFKKGAGDVIEAMNTSMGKMGAYLVLVFFAAQFTAWFAYSQIDWTIAMGLAEIIPTSLHPALVLWLFILVSMILNLFIGSASAKWTLMAPIFVTALSVLPDGPEIDPAGVTIAYRIGDSVTNIISPLMSYFALIITFAKDWDEDAGIGTVMAMMFPYSLFFFISWSIFFVIWMVFGIPFGI